MDTGPYGPREGPESPIPKTHSENLSHVTQSPLAYLIELINSKYTHRALPNSFGRGSFRHPTCTPSDFEMTRSLVGGYADVPVDSTKRTLDGDDSGDLYTFLERALAEKGVPAPLTILHASRQVVAGLNWKLLVEKNDDNDNNDTNDNDSCYEAVIYQHLPCNGGGFELRSLETVPRPRRPLVAHPLGTEETLEECDRSVSFALQSLSEQSNSLAPFELVRLVRATKRGRVHDLHLAVRQGRGSSIEVEVLVSEEDNGYKVDKISFL